MVRRAAFVSLFLLHSSIAYATAYTWNSSMSPEDWNVNANWTPATGFPSTAADSGTFGNIETMAATVVVPVNIIVGSVTFDNQFSYQVSIDSGFSLTFGSASVPGAISVTSQTGSHSITGADNTATLTLANTLSITQASSGNFTIGAKITQTGGSQALSIAGSQAVILTNLTNDFAGGTTISSGILQVSGDGALGDVTGGITIGSGTFQAGGTFNTDASRGFTLSGAATFNSNGFILTVDGVVSGGGSLTKIGSGTLVLTGANTYSSGTSINTGFLSVSSDGNMGNASGPLAIGNLATLLTTGSFTSARAVTITGTATVDTGSQSIGLSGNITGSGSLIKSGTGTLTLTGTNSYSGTTTISGGTLVVNSGSLPGNVVQNGTLLQFNQPSNGVYSGVISGTGPMNITGAGSLEFTGNSSGFSGATTVNNSRLIVTGNLTGSNMTIGAGSSVTGTGTIHNVDNFGAIVPGNQGLGVLSVSGNATFEMDSHMSAMIAPGNNGRLSVAGTANLNGNGELSVTPLPGFYGLTATFTLLDAGVVSGMFNSAVVTNPNFVGTFSYTGTTVDLFVRILRPFQEFPFGNSNERAVGLNIDEQNASGTISSDLAAIIDTLEGASVSTINDALDQMHPAAMSAFAEQQAEIGGQLLNIFHRKPFLICGCSNPNRIWAEPYGNWLEEKHEGQQIGFNTTTRGIAFGYDVQLFDSWTFGVGGAWSMSDLTWSLDRGHAYTESLYGSFYTDLVLDNFYFGGSMYAGRDWFTTARHIGFTTVDRQAEAHYHGLDIAGQFTAAYFFGTPACLFYPYGTVDYLYLNNDAFSESGANSLDLNVSTYTSKTLRSEAGFALQIIDKNYKETFCISPTIAFGWAMEWPFDRDNYTVTFADQPFPFIIEGWDKTWQLLNLRFGLALVYKCFTLNSQYIADISPDGGGPFFNQRANFRFSLSF